MTKQFLLFTSALTAIALSAGAASAAAADDAGGTTIGELVVTAEKREQNLQDVPVAISAYTAKQRDLIGINTVQDMTNFTPGLQYSAQLDRISLRGIGRLTNVQAADPGVATYSDGVYTSSTVEAGKTPLFTDRVEVLRGPQGTLYGRNSIGGAINVISRHPTKDWYAEVRGSYSNYNHSLIEGAVSGPLSDNVQFRIAGNWDRQTKGWYKNLGSAPDEGNIVNTALVEAQLAVQFSEKLEAWAKVSVAEWHNGAGGPGSRATWTPFPYNTVENAVAGLTMNAGYAYNAGGYATNVVDDCGPVNPAINDPRKICTDTASTVKLNDTVIFASQWTWHINDGVDLKYITGGTHYHYTLTGDLDGTSVRSYTLPGGTVVHPQYTSNYQEIKHWWSHELNLASTDSGPFQWLIGAYLYHEGYDQPVFATMADQAQVASPVNSPVPNPLRRIYDDRPHFDDKSEAIFGQADWQFTDTLKATVGLRYSHDHKYGYERLRVLCNGITACSGFPAEFFLGAVDLTQAPTVVIPSNAKGIVGPITFDPATGFATRNYDASWSAVTGTAGLEWKPDSDTLVYGRYSRGYKAGGFRAGIDTLLNPSPWTDAEHVNAYELGLKKNFGRVFQVNASGFWYDYTNAQAPLTIVPTSGGTTIASSIFYNVPKAISKGIELETIWSPIDNLQILFNYSYLDAHITEASGLVDPTDPAALDKDARPVGSIAGCTPSTCTTDIFTSGVPGGGYQRGQDLRGNSLPNAPKNKIALNANYTFRMDAGSLTFSGTYIWRDAQYGSIFQRSYNRSPSWSQVDGRITWKAANDKYTVILYGKNLLNDLGYDGGATSVRRAGTINRNPFLGQTPVNLVEGVSSTYPITAPRTYGIELQYRFF